jgi:hypothetical protein
MPIRITNDSGWASYPAFKTMVNDMGTPDKVYYYTDPQLINPTLVYGAVALFNAANNIILLDLNTTTHTKPLETTFLTDFPSAVKAYFSDVEV